MKRDKCTNQVQQSVYSWRIMSLQQTTTLKARSSLKAKWNRQAKITSETKDYDN